jgi:ATP-dependent helicase/nuclease subunit B
MPLYTQLCLVQTSFWTQVANSVLEFAQRELALSRQSRDFSALRILVPTYTHVHLLQQALYAELGGDFIPPRIQTPFACVGMHLPSQDWPSAQAQSERLMSLYQGLRQHVWLKNLFGAKENVDLLPLTHTLLQLSDELTRTWLPHSLNKPESIQEKWQQALQQLAPPVQHLISEETQLVWSIWQSQIDDRDALVQYLQTWLEIADQAQEPLIWIAPNLPDAFESAFLQRYQEQHAVLQIHLDWRTSMLPASLAQAWPQMSTAHEPTGNSQLEAKTIQDELSHLSLCPAYSLEDEAEQGAQWILHWLQQGKQKLAVIAQDRLVSRRLRALLERAQVYVADETGWKLSTTRAAAGLAAWFELVATRADTMVLLDFLKSPFLPIPASESVPEVTQAMGENAALEVIEKSDVVMTIEMALRRNNVVGSWDAIIASLSGQVQLQFARTWIIKIARLAQRYTGRKSLSDWCLATQIVLQELNMADHLQEDSAGAQLLQLLQALQSECQTVTAQFSFSEWRALVNMQLEETPFIQTHEDHRVVMLPLNGAHLRSFDAVLLMGADASHLPSRAKETLFFSNAVRRDCGLITVEQRQQQQLRDFAELILLNPEIVITWQTQQNGEANPLSPWLLQLDLLRERFGLPATPHVRRNLHTQELPAFTVNPAQIAAAKLMPSSLSSSGYSSLIACPYQFFAGRMLKLAALDELNDTPEKREYGDWLHGILQRYHEQLKEQALPKGAARQALLQQLSDDLFNQILEKTPVALAFSVRWNQVLPAYVEWADQRETEGWQFAEAEVWMEQKLSWENGEIMLRGRVDRVDQNADGERVVLDYKTRNLASLKKRIKDQRDHQLAFYGLLASTPLAGASYVALEHTKHKIDAAGAQDYEAWQGALKNSITETMQAIQNELPMKAQGIEAVCQYCDMRGLCRKGAW